jgi:hypothetical protein
MVSCITGYSGIPKLALPFLWRFKATFYKSEELVLHRESPCLLNRSYQTVDLKILKTVGEL